MNFALRLKELREKKGISQAQLAKKLNVGTASVGMWESTQRTPPAKKLQSIAGYFGVSVDYLLGRDEVTLADRMSGWIDTAPEKLTSIEYEMLQRFRDVGYKHGEQAQRALITVSEKML